MKVILRRHLILHLSFKDLIVMTSEVIGLLSHHIAKSLACWISTKVSPLQSLLKFSASYTDCGIVSVQVSQGLGWPEMNFSIPHSQIQRAVYGASHMTGFSGYSHSPSLSEISAISMTNVVFNFAPSYRFEEKNNCLQSNFRSKNATKEHNTKAKGVWKGT